MPTRFGNALKRLLLPAVLIVVALIPSGMFYYHINSRSAYLTTRDYRLLTLMNTQLTETVGNFRHIVHNTATEVSTSSKSATSAHTTQADFCSKFEEVLRDSPIAYLQDVQCERQSYKTSQQNDSSANESETPRLEIDEADIETPISLVFVVKPKAAIKAAHSTKHNPDPRYVVTLKVRLEDLFSRLDSAELSGTHLFDDLALVDSLGGVRAHNALSGINLVVLNDSMTSNKSGNQPQHSELSQPSGAGREKVDSVTPHPVLADFDNPTNIQIGGTEYKLFVLPTKLLLSTPAHSNTGNRTSTNLLLCGLISKNRFRSEAITVNYFTVIAWAAVITIGFLSWPFVNLMFMRPTDKVRLIDGALLASATIAASAIVALLVVDVVWLGALNQDIDTDLVQLSQQIKTHLADEIVLAHQQLANFTAQREFTAAAKAWNTPRCDSCKRENLLRSDLSTLSYPTFNLATWVDSTGMQRIKWASRRATPFIDLSTRPEYLNLHKGQHWPVFDSSGTKIFDFWLGPSYSPNTGEQLAVYGELQQGTMFAGYIATPMMSLFRTLLPQSFGFAIIDRNGKVLFHSDETRNERENFFDECDHDVKLQSAVLSGSDEIVTSLYFGREYNMFVTPLYEQRALLLPWTLIVFRDSRLTDTSNLEAFASAAILFGLYASLASIVWLTSYLLWHPTYPLDWSWPSPGRADDYYHIVLTFASLILASVYLLLFTNDIGAMTFVLLVPFYGAMLAVYRLRYWTRFRSRRAPVTGGARTVLKNWTLVVSAVGAASIMLAVLTCNRVFDDLSGHRVTYYTVMVAALGIATIVCFKVPRLRETENLYKHTYIAMGCAFVCLAGLLPALVLFRVSWHQQMETLAALGQEHIAASFDQRRKRVLEQYSDWDEKTWPGKSAFIAGTYPVSGSSLDVYASAFRQSRFDKPMEHANAVSPWHKYIGHFILPFNALATELRGIQAQLSTSGKWTNDTVHGQLIRTKADALTQGGTPDIIVSNIPVDAPFKTKNLIPVFIGLMGFVFYWVWKTSAKVFFMTSNHFAHYYSEETLLPEVVGENVLALGLSFCGKSRRFQALTNINLVDMAQIGSRKNWAHTFNYAKLRSLDAIAVDHFDYLMSDVNFSKEKLYFIEQLVYTERRKVLIISVVDPLYFIASDERFTSDDRDRWARVLGSFRKVALRDEFSVLPWRGVGLLRRGLVRSKQFSKIEIFQLCRFFYGECAPTSHLSLIGWEIARDLASGFNEGRERNTTDVLKREFIYHSNAYYRSLWSDCTWEEKINLVNLAEGGLLNPTAKSVLPELMRRRLITKPSCFEVMNESFRDYLKDCRREVRVLESKNIEGRWNWPRWLFVALLVGCFVPFYVVEADAIQGGLPTLASYAGPVLAVASAAVYKLVGSALARKVAAES